MITDNLISEVLGFKCSSYQELGDNIIYPLVHYGWLKGIEQICNAKQYPKGINIYELAHKCKEWAFEKNYKYKGEDGVLYVYYLEKLVKTIVSDKVKNWYDVSIDFQACEWIMEQTK